MSNPAYETGACTSLDDFFTKLWTFCTSTIDVTYRFSNESVTTPQTLNTAGGGTGTTYGYAVKCLSRGGYYWWLRYHTTGGVYGMVAPNGGASGWASITGRPTYDCKIFPLPGAGTYHFFSVNYVIHAICVLANGVCVHVNFGTLDKVGSWTGGEFFTGTWADTSTLALVNNDPDSTSHRFSFHVGSASARSANSQENGMMRCVYNSQNFALMDSSNTAVASGYNLVLALGGLQAEGSYGGNAQTLDDSFSPNSYTPYRSDGVPIEYQLYKDADDSLLYDLGVVPGARFVNMQYLDTADAVNDDWLVFPLCYKGEIGSVGSYAATGNYGIAYYKGP